MNTDEVKKFDVTDFVFPGNDKQAYDIRKCEKPRPKFFEGTFEDLENSIQGIETDGLKLEKLSEVALSSSNEHAILYYEYDCGGLCGAGSFILLENTQTGWKKIGKRIVRVS